MRYLKPKKTFLKTIFFIVALITLNGCLFEAFISSGLNLREENSTILIADETYLYKAIFLSSTSNQNRTRIERTNLKTSTSEIYIGQTTSAITDGTGSGVRFSNINAMVKIPNTNLIYIGDTCTIRLFDTSTMSVNIVAGISGTCTSLDGVGTAATFATVTGLTYDGNNYLYISDYYSIRRMDLQTKEVTTIAGVYGGTTDVNDIGTNARFGTLGEVAYLDNNLYVLDTTYMKIKKISLNNFSVTTFIGNGSSSLKDGIGTNAEVFLTEASKITTDGVNLLFFTQNNAIRKVDVTNQKLTTLFRSDDAMEDIDGALDTAKSYYPSGIVYTGEGLFFSNFYGIRRLR